MSSEETNANVNIQADNPEPSEINPAVSDGEEEITLIEKSPEKQNEPKTIESTEKQEDKNTKNATISEVKVKELKPTSRFNTLKDGKIQPMELDKLINFGPLKEIDTNREDALIIGDVTSMIFNLYKNLDIRDIVKDFAIRTKKAKSILEIPVEWFFCYSIALDKEQDVSDDEINDSVVYSGEFKKVYEEEVKKELKKKVPRQINSFLGKIECQYLDHVLNSYENASPLKMERILSEIYAACYIEVKGVEIIKTIIPKLKNSAGIENVRKTTDFSRFFGGSVFKTKVFKFLKKIQKSTNIEHESFINDSWTTIMRKVNECEMNIYELSDLEELKKIPSMIAHAVVQATELRMTKETSKTLLSPNVREFVNSRDRNTDVSYLLGIIQQLFADVKDIHMNSSVISEPSTAKESTKPVAENITPESLVGRVKEDSIESKIKGFFELPEDDQFFVYMKINKDFSHKLYKLIKDLSEGKKLDDGLQKAYKANKSFIDFRVQREQRQKQKSKRDVNKKSNDQPSSSSKDDQRKRTFSSRKDQTQEDQNKKPKIERNKETSQDNSDDPVEIVRQVFIGTTVKENDDNSFTVEEYDMNISNLLPKLEQVMPIDPSQDKNLIVLHKEENEVIHCEIDPIMIRRVYDCQSNKVVIDTGSQLNLIQNKAFFVGQPEECKKTFRGPQNESRMSYATLHGKAKIGCVNGSDIIVESAYYSDDICENIINPNSIPNVTFISNYNRPKLIWNNTGEEFETELIKSTEKHASVIIADLFKLIPKVGRVQEGNSVEFIKQSIMALHKQGHVNFREIIDNIRHGNISNIDPQLVKGVSPKNFSCESCDLAKITNKSFYSSYSRMNKVGDLIHADLMGPLPESIGKRYKYVAVFVDDMSKYIWSIPLQQKSEATNQLIALITEIERQFETKVKIVRTDNGGEFNNSVINAFFTQIGIKHQLTVPYAHQQNGTVERSNRTIMNLVRATMIESNIHEVFWPYVVKYVVHIINTSYLRDHPLKNKRYTSHTLLTGKKINRHSNYIFGSDCILFIPQERQTGKLTVRGQKGIYLGSAEDTKGIVAYNIPQNRVVVAIAYKLNDGNFSHIQDLRESAKQLTNISQEDLWKQTEVNIVFGVDSQVRAETTDIPLQGGNSNSHLGYQQNINYFNQLSNQTSNVNKSDELQRRLNERETELQTQKQKLESISNAYRVSAQQISNLRSKNDQEIREMEEKIKSKDEEIHKCTQSLRSLTEKVNKLESQLKESHEQSEQIKTLEETIKSDKASRVKLEKELTDIRLQNKELMLIIEDNKKKSQEFKHHDKYLQKQIKALNEQIGEIEVQKDKENVMFHDQIEQLKTTPVDKLEQSKQLVEIYNNASARRPRRATTLKENRDAYIDKMNLESDIVRFITNSQIKKSDVSIPMNASQALKSKYAIEWQQAMDDEMKSQNNLNVWTILSDQERKEKQDIKITKTRWVFAVKTNHEGFVERFKARLVAKGFTQTEGVDYYLTYSPTLNTENLKIILAYATIQEMRICQLDIKTAFLHGTIDTNVYISLPESQSKTIAKLNKSIYGLKQSARNWYLTLREQILNLGFEYSTHDPNIYIKDDHDDIILIVIYVDDILILSKDEGKLKETKDKILSKFEGRSQDGIDQFLGLVINQDLEKGTLSISTEKYIDNMLQNFDLQDIRTYKTPMLEQVRLEDETSHLTEEEHQHYQQLVGTLRYLTTVSRPDIAFAVRKVSHFLSSPQEHHLKAVYRIIGYLKYTKNRMIMYDKRNTKLEVYADASFCVPDEKYKSVTGILVKFAGSPIYWRTKRQTIVTTSTRDAELLALHEAIAITERIILILKSVGWKSLRNNPIQVYEDNRPLISSLINGDYQRVKNARIMNRFDYVVTAIESKKVEYL
ncbi:gag-pol fusion protein [Sugiyamaella lignohabitans]|uniref:Gag-pol fusion protein n=1 Tax=Sugiyamaella lignohabitans TaxID=796027 RepID=A0A161HJI4_9ASCO|nr:gag-pol fusion protein [Sugiyamaella lignohabitans]ANB11578.1 gag-pol fusion protein [Sugiyamaella lignohabitans]